MVLGQQFGDLDGVGRRPFSQVVADAPEREAVRVGEVFPDAADEDKVAAGAGAGHRVAALYFFVHDFDAGERREEFLCLFDRDRAFGFDEDRFAVAVGDRDAHARRADHDRLVTENLASLVDHLHLFAGVALFLEAADLRDGVERDRRLERLLFVGGLIEIERVFNYPGFGSVLLAAVTAKDFALLQTAVLLTGVVIVCFQLLSDVLFALLNPRIRQRVAE